MMERFSRESCSSRALRSRAEAFEVMNRTRNTVRAYASIAALTLACSGVSLWAQTDSGRVTGVVEDASAAIIPGAKVTIVNTGTSATLTSTSDDGGNFNFPALPRGTYRISAT